jgi:hypothetical protein
MKTITVTCSHCGRDFDKLLKHHKYSVKVGWKQYCGTKCRDAAKITSLKRTCASCGKEILVYQSNLLKSLSGRVFCGCSCSARFNNKIRGKRTEEEKNNIRKGLVSYHEKMGTTARTLFCVVCGSPYKDQFLRKSCSKRCGAILRTGRIPLSREEIMARILDLAGSLQRTPQRREFDSSLRSAAVHAFGTWNKAISACGLKTYPKPFSPKKVKCEDGHMASSISEAIVDNWLFAHGISHARNKVYPGTKMTCDFFLMDKNVWVEYFGLSGRSDYDEGIEKKKKMSREMGMNLVEIYPKDLYPENRLAEILP